MPLDWEQPPRTIFEDPNWEYMRRFHLVQLGILNSSLDPPFMQASLPALPTLNHLDMPDQFLTLSQLAYTQHPSTAPLDTFELVQPLKNRLEIRSPDQVARFLLAIWPKLQRLDYENESRGGQPRLEHLNMYLQTAREDRRNQKE
ncbi:hypothetical protein FRC09_016721 [Ceratobasidium sp. 395]|nr:hypothetical protein FRC09_016721 [Ceratobasidium sp. 395]